MTGSIHLTPFVYALQKTEKHFETHLGNQLVKMLPWEMGTLD